jgi:hypothetical protein
MLERARQKDGRQVVPVDVDRDDVACIWMCQRRGVRRC